MQPEGQVREMRRQLVQNYLVQPALKYYISTYYMKVHENMYPLASTKNYLVQPAVTTKIT